MKRVVGLDSLRLVLALAVLIGHLETNVLNFGADIVGRFKLLGVVNGVVNNISPGVAAVIAFFVISGFCIHYPYASGKPLNVVDFYAKRLVRIGVPAILAVALYHYTLNLYMGVIWSLVCEVIYYFLYPLILKYKKKYFGQMLVISFIASYVVSFCYMFLYGNDDGDFHRSSMVFTWIVGLPIWLLGVLLADQFLTYRNEGVQSFPKLVLLRLSVWLVAILCSIMRFHVQLPYVYTLPVFSLLVYYWIKKEIWYYADKKENKWLAYGGVMSYSIYLIHDLFIKGTKRVFNITEIESFWLWLCVIIVSLVGSWLFYLLVEKKSHLLAKSIHIKPRLANA